MPLRIPGTIRRVMLFVAAFLGAFALGTAGTIGVYAAVTPNVFPDDGDAPEPQRIGQEYLLANGTTPDGVVWAIRYYNSDQGLCMHIDLSDSTDSGSGGGCGFGLRSESVGDRAHGVGVARIEAGNQTFVFGPLEESDAESVDVAFADGTSLRTGVLPGQGVPFDFFYKRVPATTANATSLRVIAAGGFEETVVEERAL